MAIASYLVYDYDIMISGRPEGYIPFWRFIFALCLIYSVGYPLAQTAVDS